MGESTYVFQHLKTQLETESAESAIVWLGDNIYPVGLAPNESAYYPEGRHRLMAQLDVMSNFEGYKYFIPGNHDWYTYGRLGLRRQEILVDSFLQHTPNPNNQINFFVPDKGCGDPQLKELTSGINLLMMDSHWFLSEKARTGDQTVCQVKTPQEYIQKLKEEIASSTDESLIVASHHPPYTYAHHGGKFSFKDNVFPLTQLVDWLYLPMPIMGYLTNKSRTRISEQDVYHPLYITYRNKLIEALESKGKSIVASGHEHTLQFIENHNQYFIVSGAGTKNNKVGMGEGSEFAIGQKGYVKLIFSNPKDVLVQYIVPGHNEDQDNVVFDKYITLD